MTLGVHNVSVHDATGGAPSGSIINNGLSNSNAGSGPTTTAGSTLIAVFGSVLSSTLPEISAPDSLGNTWTEVGSGITYAGGGYRIRVYKQVGGARGAGHTVTVAKNLNNEATFFFVEILGGGDVSGFQPRTVGSTASGATGTGVAITTATANETIIAGVFGEGSGNSHTYTPTAPWTRIDNETAPAGITIQAELSYRDAATPGTYTPSWVYTVPFAETAATFTVSILAGGPTITAQPTGQAVNNGATATFSVTATGTAPITYQWQDNSSGSFANIGGATSSSYSPTASYAAQGRQYRCVVTDANGSATSAAATLRVAFNLSGTGPRSVPLLGHPFGAGSVESYIRGTASGGAPSHATSGALAAQSATIAGTADHRTLHPTSGALASQSATIAGSATHLLLHTTTGALSAQAATISGTAQHQHAATGALSAQAATVAGSAAHLTLHTTTGALSSQSATIAGSAAHQHAATGALQAQAATISGSADHTAAGASHSTSGALNANAATIAGSATHLTLHTTTGALSAQSATISGAALHPHITSGALQAQSATLAGAAAHATLHTTSGTLSAQAATISGAAAHEHASAGALASQSATVAGTATHAAAGVHIAAGALQAGDASISGSAAAPVQRQILGGWAKFRRYERRTNDEEDTKTPQPDDAPVVEAVAPKQRIKGRIRIADIAARLAEQQQADADALERQAVERARRKRRQQQEEELLLF